MADEYRRVPRDPRARLGHPEALSKSKCNGEWLGVRGSNSKVSVEVRSRDFKSLRASAPLRRSRRIVPGLGELRRNPLKTGPFC